jgi:hypothetical protein
MCVIDLKPAAVAGTPYVSSLTDAGSSIFDPERKLALEVKLERIT